MAWRPTEHLIEGELDNTQPGRVTGWMRFAGMKERVAFDLEGDFHRDIRGAKIHLTGDGQMDDPEAHSYMASFSPQQTGKAGDITAGLPPADYVAGYCYYVESIVMRRCGGNHREGFVGHVHSPHNDGTSVGEATRYDWSANSERAQRCSVPRSLHRSATIIMWSWLASTAFVAATSAVQLNISAILT